MTEQDCFGIALFGLTNLGLAICLWVQWQKIIGIPRSTHDIDFVIEYEAEDISRIVKMFEADFFIQRTSVQSALNPDKLPCLIYLLTKVYTVPVQRSGQPVGDESRFFSLGW